MNVEFITGQAGTGKTYEILQRMERNPNWGKLCATTGIAAINLGGEAVTINSLLKFYDLESLKEKAASGLLDTSLYNVALEKVALVLDEVSMMGGEALDILYSAIDRINKNVDLDLVLTGDFAQLPPIDASWAFRADCWPEFEANTTTLTEVHRQKNPTFLAAVNAARKGNGSASASFLHEAGVKFCRSLDPNFPGTTIFGTNKRVDAYNAGRMAKIKSPEIRTQNYRWGKQLNEWTSNIPREIVLKEGALVMLLVNDRTAFTYANGDLGEVVATELGYYPVNGTPKFAVKLQRSGETVDICKITRRNEVKTIPEEMYADSFEEWPSMVEMECEHGTRTMMVPNREPEPWNQAYYDPYRGRYVIGAIRYFPLRLAYASTVHKTQGLSLDSVQIDVNGTFLKEPAMTYVALSRVCRPEGLRIVGRENVYVSRVKAAAEVSRWL